jgi:branched-chain amino acid transport system permease protein/neutral amino acid transport system permease protein
MDFLTFINFFIIPGIIVGAIYASGAIAINLLFGVLRFANLAIGDMITLGAYWALMAKVLGAPLWLALICSIVLSAMCALLLDKLFYAYLRPKPRIMMVMASLGVAFMIRAVVQVIWGVDPLSYSTGISRPERYAGLLLKDRELWTLAVIVSVFVGLFSYLKFSKWGKALLAYANNPELVSLCGVSVTRLIFITWLIVGTLVAICGFFMGLNTELKSMMGWHLLLPMFAAAILGGVGRIEGAIIGGFIIGLLEEMSVLVFPAEYKSAVAFVVLIAILLLRPTGLLKGKVL